MIEPVSVAMSTSRSAPWLTACVRQSASTSRPSASVLMISIVVPLAAVTTSPGLTAVPDGMFSVAPTTATTRTGSRSSAIASIAPSTAAPPDMSNFMSDILLAPLIEIPPESNVTALPTSPSTGPLCVRPLVLERDQLGLLHRALGHAGERAHAEPLEALRGPRPRP